MNKGYTLIELLIGLTIIAILFGVGIVNYREFSQRQVFTSSVKKMQGQLRAIQESAVSGEKPDHIRCNTPETLIGYYITKNDENSYSVYASCSGGNVFIKDVLMPETITITSISVDPLMFKSLAQGTNIPSGTQASIVLSQEGTESTNTIYVNYTGDIQ